MTDPTQPSPSTESAVLLRYEGQQFQIPQTVAASDDAIRRTLTAAFPEAAGATISRDKNGTISVRRKPKSKGTQTQQTPLDSLRQAPACVSPATVLASYLEWERPPLHQAIALASLAESYIRDIEPEINKYQRHLAFLRQARAQPFPASIAL